jgi:dinuclear metal center YbgI/SA1388 family protein
MERARFTALLDEIFPPGRFTDTAENGLQVEGGAEVTRVVTGVTANLALIDAAVAASADAIVVHHGLVWGGGIRRLDGWLKVRVERLLRHGISLYAYHLPLDAHPEIGNNVGLAKALGVVGLQPFGRYKGQFIGYRGVIEPATTLPALVARARAEVVGDGAVAAFGDASRPIRTVGLCSGGAPDLVHEAVSLGLDAYVTGETTEYVKAIADESGTAFLALGHHATERFGARALAGALCALGVQASFVDVENPV